MIYSVFHAWGTPETSLQFGDTALNLALYFPLGASGYLAFRRRMGPLLASLMPVVLGFALSTSIEMAQLFQPARICNTLDILFNTAGSVIGVGAGRIYAAGVRKWADAARRRLPDPASVALLVCWISYLFFPFIPTAGRADIAHRTDLFFQSSLAAPARIAWAAMAWLVAGRLLYASGIQVAWPWLALTAIAIPLQIFIPGRQPAIWDMIGAAAGCLLFHFWGRQARPASWIAAFVLFVLVFHGLSPFRFAGEPREFSWIPFSGLLASKWQIGAVVLLEKTFFYGGAVWVLRSAKLNFGAAIAIVAAVLGIVEWWQRYLPGRTPEVTDPVMAVLLGVAMVTLERSPMVRRRVS